MSKDEKLEVLRAKFIRVFSKIPLELRDEIIAVIDDEPVTWSVANITIKGRTKNWDKLLKLMDDLKLLGD